MRALAPVAALLIFTAAANGADDHPYAGLWGEAARDAFKEDPEFFGPDACYNKFTEQMPDGRFRYYLVDHAKWRDEGKIEYLLAQEGTCTLNEGGKSEKCVGKVMGERESEWFIAYEGKDANGLRASYYENVFYFQQRFNGEPLVRHQCPFDMAAITPYITGKTIADCTTRCRGFGTSEQVEFRAMVDAIKSKK